MAPEIFVSLRDHRQCGKIFEACIEGIYNRVVSAWSTAIDGGANHGRHTIPLARRVWAGRVLAFEPLPIVSERLTAAVTAAGLASRIDIVRAALSDSHGVAKFNYVNHPSGDPRFPFSNAAFSGFKLFPQKTKELSSEEITVSTTTIDSHVERQSGRVEFIKLDVEGGEYQALLGARAVLAKHRPVVAYEDDGPEVGAVYGYEPRELLALFRSLGYDLFYITGHRFSDEDWLSRSEAHWRPFYTVAAPASMNLGWLIRRVFNDEARREKLGGDFGDDLAETVL